MKRFFGATAYASLLAFGIFLIVRGYQHVMFVPALFGLFLVVALLLFAAFRAVFFRRLRDPRGRSLVEFVRDWGARVGPRSLLAALPLLAAGALFLVILVNLRHWAPWALSCGGALRYWYLNELLALLFSPFLVWVFVRGDRTPVWQRVVALPTALMLFGGFWFFVKVVQYVWAFVAFRCAMLYLQRPSNEDSAVGCLHVILDLVLLALLGAFLVYRRDYATGPAGFLHPDLRPLGASMLFGCLYYGLLGASEVLFRPFLFALSDAVLRRKGLPPAS